MNSSANLAGSDASVIDLELNNLDQPISADAQTETVLDAVVVQALYEEIPAESQFSSPLLKVLGFSALSGAALSLMTPMMGWQMSKLLPTLGTDDSDSASDVDDGIDWVAPPPTESKPQIALAETSPPSFTTRSNGPSLSGQARLPLPTSQAIAPVTSPTFSSSLGLPSRPLSDFQSFASINVTPKPVALDLLPPPLSGSAVSTPASEPPVLTVPDINATPTRQGRPVTAQASRQNVELATLPSIEPVRISALPNTAETTVQPSEIDQHMREETSPAPAEEVILTDANLEESTLAESSGTTVTPTEEVEPAIAQAQIDQFADVAFEEAAPISRVFSPEESVDSDSTIAELAPLAEARDPKVEVIDSVEGIDLSEVADSEATLDLSAKITLSEMTLPIDASSVFILTDEQMSVEELVVDNPELLSLAMAEYGEVVVPTETGDFLIETLTVDEIFPETIHVGESTLTVEQVEQRLTMRPGSNEQLISTEINGESVLLSVTHLSPDDSMVIASTHQRLAQQLGKQTKQVSQ